MDPFGEDIYPYPDPDRTRGTASIGNVTIDVSGSNICSCTSPADVIISITATWTGASNINEMMGSIGEVHIDRCRIPFPNATPPTPPGPTSMPIRFAIPAGTCSGGSGSTTVRIVDLTRSRLRPLAPNPPFGGGGPWTGVSTIVRVSWDWACQNDCTEPCVFDCSVCGSFKIRERLE